jgi:hypothetical protein
LPPLSVKEDPFALTRIGADAAYAAGDATRTKESGSRRATAAAVRFGGIRNLMQGSV